MFDPLTYRYKRTTLDAFGCDASEAVAVHKYEPAVYKRVLYAICDYGTVVLIGVALAYAFVYGWSTP